MKVQVLGCSGGIGGRHLRTTALRVDQDILIDAGTGVGELSIPELAMIDHVFLTHSHLDHITSLPLLLDTVADRRNKPLMVYASAAVLTILRNHIFNWAIWPDFTEIPNVERPMLRLQPIELGQVVNLDGRQVCALPVHHTVPAVGYHLTSGQGSLVFSGDTGPCDAFWDAVNRIADLRCLVIECAFSNREEKLARLSRHLCPSLLARELQKWVRPCDLYITHLKPGQIELTMEELAACLGEYRPRMLQNNQVIEL